MCYLGDAGTVSRHLKAGDPEPSVDENKFTLLGFLFCPFCDRVRLTLNYHKIEYEQILVSLYDKPEWFTNLSPSGKVPLLLNRGDRLSESDLIMRFVDELRGPDASLLKVCGLEKFNEAAELSTKVSDAAPVFKHVRRDQLSLADLVLFPMIDRLEVILCQLNGQPPESVAEFKPDHSVEYPALVNYLSRLRQISWIAANRQPLRVVSLFCASVRAGKPNLEIA
ncbi:glutathione S-transferase omega-1 [Clonorchis sinensis]|uniref:Glutathione S-transferase omega-1 n=1 Tax=Clonorchis sinensis TaxID=79923 RepID=G7YE46_CLOSI|nr:glutathione transferase omega-2 [Clonorchis sinensis]GAA51230.1 glutathione S-transferase omega-1 [Clonorchis sinensis]